jgi:imidazolonepropionase-like amidohydrolase
LGGQHEKVRSIAGSDASSAAISIARSCRPVRPFDLNDPGKWLLLEAGLATGFDLPDEDALKAVTINAAEILGVADRVGSLEPGKDADVIILDGYPLSVKTWVEKVFINGVEVYSKK